MAVDYMNLTEGEAQVLRDARAGCANEIARLEGVPRKSLSDCYSTRAAAEAAKDHSHERQ